MKILIVSATENEISNFNKQAYPSVDILITGIGIPAAILKLSTILSKNKYDLILNVGISGSFTKTLKIGEIVHVKTELFGDLGFENTNSFIPLSKTNFSKLQKLAFSNSNTHSIFNSFKQVNGITVNSSSGTSKTIEIRKSLFKADVESMEGAAVFYVCSENNIPFVQIRSISNYIEERNPKNWDIPLAINNLNTELEKILNSINKE